MARTLGVGNQTPASPERYSSMAVVVRATAAMTIGQGFARFSFPVLLPDMLGDVVDSYASAGLLGTVNLASYLAGVIAMSFMSGRIPASTLVKGGLAGALLGTLVMAAAPNFAVLVVGMMIGGIGCAGTWVPLVSVVNSAVEPHRRGLAMGIVVSGFGIGVVAAGQLRSLVYVFAGDKAWRDVWLVEAAIIAVVLFTFLVWFRPPPEVAPLVNQGKLELMRSIPAWRRLLLAYALFGLGYIVFTSYLTAMLQDEAGFTASHASTVFSVLGFATIIGGTLFGQISDRMGRRAAFVSGSLILSGCSLLVLVRDEPWIIICAALYGAVVSGPGTIVAVYVGDHLTGPAVSTAFGLFTVVFGTAQASGPWIGGFVADRAGSFTWTFVLASTSLALAAVVGSGLPGNVDRREALVLP